MAHAGSRRFGAAQGARFSDEDAQRFGRYLDRKGALDGPVDAERIVKLAKPKASPLHDYIFDVDDRTAAHEYRLNRARELVRHIVVIKDIDGEEVETRAYHHVTVKHRDGEDEKGYLAEKVVFQSPDLSAQVIRRALRELLGWRKRYKQYTEFAELFAAIDNFNGDGDDSEEEAA